MSNRHARPPEKRRSIRSLTLLASLTVGALVLAGVGSIAIAAPAAPAVRPASQFTVALGDIRPASGKPAPASGTQASLWSNRSTASTTVSGAGRVLIGAIGDNCEGWPRIKVTVDGAPVGTTRIVNATYYGTYPVGAAVGPGNHRVDVQFINDLRTAACDRNVHIGYVRMQDPTATAPVAAAPAKPKPVPVPVAPAKPAPTTAPTSSPAPTSPAPSSPAPAGPVAGTGTSSGSSTDGDADPPTEVPDPPAQVVPDPAKPVKPNPNVPGSAPGPQNTGVPPGTKLTVHQGDLTVTQDGTVIDGLDIHGFLRINADNVTVRNTLIRGGNPGTTLKSLVSAYGGKNFTIEDSTLRSDMSTPYVDGLKGHHFTASRLDISNVVDTALVFGDDVVIRDSWLHDTGHFSPWPKQPDNQTHDDNLEIVGGHNILVEGNTFETAHNTAIMITQDYSTSGNIRVIGNWLSGGQCTVNLAEKGKGPITSTFTDNVFGPSGVPNCALIAAPSSTPTMSGNTWQGTTSTPEVRKRSN